MLMLGTSRVTPDPETCPQANPGQREGDADVQCQQPPTSTTLQKQTNSRSSSSVGNGACRIQESERTKSPVWTETHNGLSWSTGPKTFKIGYKKMSISLWKENVRIFISMISNYRKHLLVTVSTQRALEPPPGLPVRHWLPGGEAGAAGPGADLGPRSLLPVRQGTRLGRAARPARGAGFQDSLVYF